MLPSDHRIPGSATGYSAKAPSPLDVARPSQDRTTLRPVAGAPPLGQHAQRPIATGPFL
jgi:hypothetical protein